MTAIGVHFPKAGGTSLLRAMERHFGDRLHQDYGSDRPLDPEGQRQHDPEAYFARRDPLPEGKDVVYGHFNAAKFAHHDAPRFTVLRHPVDTFISIYFYWQIGPATHALHRHVLDEKLTLLEMTRFRALTHIMSFSFFENVDMATFDVIGRHEDRTSTNARIAALLGMPMFDDHENVTPPSPARAEAEADPRVRAALETALRDDIAFYERWAR